MVSYKESGVDISRGDELVGRLQKLCPAIGGFGGLYPLGDSFLVASTDGVGTKLKLAFDMNQHETIGLDLVAMCVNDVITAGARPLFLLDYFATSKLDVDQAEKVLHGVIKGCQEAECALLGGETAEMPGFYKEGEYDIAGFTVGLVKKSDLIDGSTIRPGDRLVGLASTGVHSNGYSLVRRVISEVGALLDEPFGSSDQTLGEVLLTPTRIYVKQIFEILQHVKIKGMAHITGGGLLENVPRMLHNSVSAEINKGGWHIPPIFRWLQQQGNVADEEMYRVFNMGIGMVLALSEADAASLVKMRSDCTMIGEIQPGEGCVVWN